MCTDWSGALSAFAQSNELYISSRRADGTFRPAIPIWGVVVGDALYVRSQAGPENGWYRRALSSGLGRMAAGDLTVDVRFAQATAVDHRAVDAAYHHKYDYFGNIDGIVGATVWDVTLVITPEDSRAARSSTSASLPRGDGQRER